jgi:hypothetical protein
MIADFISRQLRNIKFQKSPAVSSFRNCPPRNNKISAVKAPSRVSAAFCGPSRNLDSNRRLQQQQHPSAAAAVRRSSLPNRNGLETGIGGMLNVFFIFSDRWFEMAAALQPLLLSLVNRIADGQRQNQNQQQSNNNEVELKQHQYFNGSSSSSSSSCNEFDDRRSLLIALIIFECFGKIQTEQTQKSSTTVNGMFLSNSRCPSPDGNCCISTVRSSITTTRDYSVAAVGGRNVNAGLQPSRTIFSLLLDHADHQQRSACEVSQFVIERILLFLF